MKQTPVLDQIDTILDTICASPLTHGTLSTVEFSCLLLLAIRQRAVLEAGNCRADPPSVSDAWKAQILSKFVVKPEQAFCEYLEGLNLELPEKARLLTTELRNLRAQLDLPGSLQIRQWVPEVIPWMKKDNSEGIAWPEAIVKLQKYVPQMRESEVRNTLQLLLELGQLDLDKRMRLLYCHPQGEPPFFSCFDG